ncbi:MAG: spermidine synthase, partial [Myxococcota bacterium]
GPVLATTLRVVLSAIVLLPPTLAMGATLPLLVADWMRRDPEATRAIPRLYAANTLGAAVGILAGTYLILPYLGIFRTLVLVAALDLIAAAGAIWVTRRIRKTGTHSQPREPREPTDDVIRPRALIAAVFTGSVVLFGLEVQWTHTLAVVVGNSAYAFGIMLFCVLAGLAIGGRSAERVPPALRPDALSRDAVLFAAVVGASLLLWDRVPMLFHVMGYSAHSFSARESIRFLVCLAFLFPPCFLSGRIYALAMALYASAGAGVGKRVGGLSAASTVGAVIGSLSGSFLILPLLGSDLGMRVAAAGLLGTAALYALAMRTSANGQRVAVLAGVATIALLAFIPRWNVNRLTDGANVYFQAQWPGETVFVHEDKFGGLTTVREHTDGTYTLLTNGKFQGSNSNEVEAQRSFALFPILHQQQFGKALVVGLGTGMTAATVARFPFEEVVVAEISPGIIEAARRYFGDINDGVVDRLGSSLKREDGRHQLLITNDHYDLISMEITSIWFAGAAALYNREFYDMVRGRLTQTGIFQQWIQLHHIYPKDLASVLASLRAVFPHVELFVGGGQGVLVAAVNPLHADPVKLRGWCQQARFTDACRLAGGRLDAVPLDDARLLDGAGIDRFLSQVASELGVDVASLISTDDSLSLEYATPRGNVLPEDSGMRMRRYLAGFQEN